MRTHAATRALTVLLATGLLVSGCGKKAGDDAPAAAAPSTPAASVTATPTPTPSATVTPKPTKKPKPATGNGDSEGDDTPATAGGGICADLDATEVGAVLKATVTGSGLPAGGCAFGQPDDAAPAVSIVETSFAQTPGGIAGAKDGATSSVEGTPVDLTGIGDAAFVVTGTAFGGTDVQGAGAVLVGDRLVNLNISQGAGLPRAKVKALVVAVLRLCASKLA